MAKARQSIIERRNARRKHTANMSRRQTMTKVGAGLVLFASAAVLTQVATPTISVSAQTTKSQFLQLVAPYARDIAGKNDLYASVMIAQAALESGWGNSGLSSAPNYNLFGIKGSYNGNTVHFDTLEDDGSGNYYQINDGFRKYSNYGESLQDYADLLTGNHDPSTWRYNFYKGARVSETNSYQDATAYLTGRYATDTSYASKLNAIIEQNNLTQYDTRSGSSNNASVPAPQNTPAPSAPSVSGGGSYTVQAGDSYWRIANKYGISIQELQRLNGTSDYFLYPGQSLKVPGSSSNASTNTPAPSMPSTPSTPSRPSAPSVSGGGSYTVQAGDSYWRIANKYGISIQELQRLNGTSDY
ncbi:LysM peptidoglycan-binding domain-containing protein, partial [Aerococcaceae bacterium NML190938]|nr:LysM peptidoglycan-binding domain-containing protein [Aerococcaceae bacterium NML190938]